jgi:hypothetical protein
VLPAKMVISFVSMKKQIFGDHLQIKIDIGFTSRMKKDRNFRSMLDGKKVKQPGIKTRRFLRRKVFAISKTNNFKYR